MNYQRIYILILLGLSFVTFFVSEGLFKKMLLFLLLLIVCLPACFLLPILKKKIYVFLGVMLFVILVMCLGIFFRTIRDTLPPPIIDRTHIVGYTHYFGYPFSMDTVIFFLFISFPIVIFSIFSLFEQHSKKGKKL